MAHFVARLHRFGARVQVASGELYVHVPTSGRLRELLVPGAPVLIRPPARPGKTAGALVLVQHQGIWVSVDAQLPSRLVRGWLQRGQLPPFAGYRDVRPEAVFGGSRIDFMLTAGPLERPRALIEVKSVTLVVQGQALFPDAPTARGTRHVHELTAALAQGWRSAVVFVVQRSDAATFAANTASDPDFAAALRRAAAAGVEVYAYRCRVDPVAVTLDREIPILL